MILFINDLINNSNLYFNCCLVTLFVTIHTTSNNMPTRGQYQKR